MRLTIFKNKLILTNDFWGLSIVMSNKTTKVFHAFVPMAVIFIIRRQAEKDKRTYRLPQRADAYAR